MFCGEIGPIKGEGHGIGEPKQHKDSGTDEARKNDVRATIPTPSEFKNATNDQSPEHREMYDKNKEENDEIRRYCKTDQNDQSRTHREIKPEEKEFTTELGRGLLEFTTEPEEEKEKIVAAATAVAGNTGRDKVEGRPTGNSPSQPACRPTSEPPPSCCRPTSETPPNCEMGGISSKSSVSYCVFETADDDLREEKERFTR